MLNTLPVTPAARSPRAIVKIAGTAVTGDIELEVKNSNYFEADTFNVVLAESALPKPQGYTSDVGFEGTEGLGAQYFSTLATDTFVEVFAGFPANPGNPQQSELTSLIYGRVDDIDYDPKDGKISLRGRDLTGAFIDTKQSRNYLNKTASFIANDIASQHGIAATVTTTKQLVGSLQQTGDYQLQQTEGSDWDLLTKLAREAGFVCYIQGQTLIFGPESTGGDSYLIQWKAGQNGGPPSSNATELSFSRSLTVIKGIVVTAMSAGLQTKTSVTRSYPVGARSTTPGKAQPFGSATVYTYRLRPGLSAAQVEDFCLAQYKLITSHAMKLRAVLPADNLLQTRGGKLTVSGTGTGWDQDYFPRSITRRLSFNEGYRMEVEAQNFTPNQTAAESTQPQ